MNQVGWTQVPERGSYWMLRVGFGILRVMGYRFSQVVAFVATLYFFTTGAKSRRASRIYQQHLHRFAPTALNGPSLLNSFRHHWNFAINIMDRMYFWQGKLDRFHFTREGREHIADRKSGILLIGAHIGSFDALRAFSQDRQLKLNVVMYRAHAQNINRMLRVLNPAAEVQVVTLDEASVDQIFTLKQRLDEGEVVAILADRPAPHGRRRTVTLPFLGADAAFPQNPWILASLLECPVFLTVGLRLGSRRYHIIVEPLAERILLPRASREQSLLTYMERYVRRMEQICVAHPFQFFNFFDFWHSPTPEEGAA